MRGQALIEVLVAIALAVLIISAATVAIVGSLGNSEHSRNQAFAEQFAQEGISWLKTINDADTSNPKAILHGLVLPSNPTYCIVQDNTSPTFYTTLVEGNPIQSTCYVNSKNQKFLRDFQISSGCLGNSNSLLVKLKISWADAKCGSSSNPCNVFEDDWCDANQ